MNEVGYLSNEDYEKAVSSPLKIVQKETEGTDENYQSSYAIHCAALELMKMDGFEFQYTFDNKEDYTFTPNAILQPTPSSQTGYGQADFRSTPP